MDSQSQQGGNFTIYIGIVAEDKDPNSREIKVYCQEMLPFLEGKLKAGQAKKTVNAGTETAGDYQGTVTASNTLTAAYYDLFSNRAYPPDVRTGEQVLVINYADTDKYYWISLGRNDNLRTTERLRLAVSDKPGQEGELDDENTFFLEMDTLHKKHIVIRTSRSNGETKQYILKMDAQANSFTLCDDDDNEIIIESDLPRVRLRNKEGCFADLLQRNLILFAPDDVIIKAGRQVVYDTPQLTGSTTKGGAVTKMIVKDLSVEASNNITFDSPCVGLNGAVVATSLVAGHVQAESYSTGAKGAAYTGGSTNVGQGTAQSGNNTPNPGGGGIGNRHGAAWEQVRPALVHIAQCLDIIHAKIGTGCDTSLIRELAQACLMEKNRGE